MRCRLALLALAFVAIAPPVSAALVFQIDGRSLSAFGQNCDEPSPGTIECDPHESDSATPFAPFAPFDDTVSAGSGGASQTSSVDSGAGSMTATGSASSFSDVGFGEGTSTFEIEFLLTSDTDISLSGQVEAEEFFGFGEGLAEVRLSQGATTLYLAQVLVNADFGSEVVSYQAVLGPGTYVIEALADGYGGSFSSYDLDFSSTVVPEPGSGALAALGLLALSALQRRLRA